MSLGPSRREEGKDGEGEVGTEKPWGKPDIVTLRSLLTRLMPFVVHPRTQCV